MNTMNLTMTVEPISSRIDVCANNFDSSMNHYKLTLKNGKRRMTVYYSQGLGIRHDPELEGVLESLFLDTSDTEYEFEYWCDSFGYDKDSRRALAIYKVCKKQTEKLRKLLGDDYDTIQESIDE